MAQPKSTPNESAAGVSARWLLRDGYRLPGDDDEENEREELATNQATRATQLLDNLLDRYDRKLRPGLGGAPLVIYTDVDIRSFGPISEVCKCNR